MQTLPRAILFDLDDTLLDDSGGAADLWRETTLSAVANFGLDRADDLVAEIGRSRTWFWSNAERHRTGRLDLRAADRSIVERAARTTYGQADPALVLAIADPYRDARDARVEPFPDAMSTLALTRQLGLLSALVTNGAAIPQRAKIERFGLAQYFDHIQIEGEFGCGKPDLSVFRATLENLAVAAADSWMVGDNLEWDVAAPQALGITGIWLDRAGAGLPATASVTPDRTLRGLDELLV